MKKRIFSIALILCLIFSCAVSASAANVPDEIVHDDAEGRYTITKTYTLSAAEDPCTLIEPDFEQGGIIYTYLEMTKATQSVRETRQQTESVTIDTASKELAEVLPLFAPSIVYDQDGYTGTLYIDHTSIAIEATGYSSHSYGVTETKQLSGLDRNDPSYIPATTVKDGRTLSLYNVEWTVSGTSLVGETLVPSSYTATATYTTTVYYKSADGYTATARYSGAVENNSVDSVTYTVIYTGTPAITEPEPIPEESGPDYISIAKQVLPYLLLALLLLAALYTIYVFILRRNVKVYALSEADAEYELIYRGYICRKKTLIDVSKLDDNLNEAIIEIKKRAAAELFGKTVTVRFAMGEHKHRIARSNEDKYVYTASVTVPELAQSEEVLK